MESQRGRKTPSELLKNRSLLLFLVLLDYLTEIDLDIELFQHLLNLFSVLCVLQLSILEIIGYILFRKKRLDFWLRDMVDILVLKQDIDRFCTGIVLCL